MDPPRLHSAVLRTLRQYVVCLSDKLLIPRRPYADLIQNFHRDLLSFADEAFDAAFESLITRK